MKKTLFIAICSAVVLSSCNGGTKTTDQTTADTTTVVETVIETVVETENEMSEEAKHTEL